MTAEERMAYFQGEKSRSKSSVNTMAQKSPELILLKIKFFIAVILFIFFLSLDYTGYQIHGIGSQQIVEQVIKDWEFDERSTTL